MFAISLEERKHHCDQCGKVMAKVLREIASDKNFYVDPVTDERQPRSISDPVTGISGDQILTVADFLDKGGVFRMPMWTMHDSHMDLYEYSRVFDSGKSEGRYLFLLSDSALLLRTSKSRSPKSYCDYIIEGLVENIQKRIFENHCAFERRSDFGYHP